MFARKTMSANQRSSLYDESLQNTENTMRPCPVHPKNKKLFKILRHIESYGTCM